MFHTAMHICPIHTRSTLNQIVFFCSSYCRWIRSQELHSAPWSGRSSTLKLQTVPPNSAQSCSFPVFLACYLPLPPLCSITDLSTTLAPLVFKSFPPRKGPPPPLELPLVKRFACVLAIMLLMYSHYIYFYDYALVVVTSAQDSAPSQSICLLRPLTISTSHAR